MNPDDFKMDDKYPTNYVAIFDMDKIQKKSLKKIEMRVPIGKEGIFIGRDGWQLRHWCSMLGISSIKVSPRS